MTGNVVFMLQQFAKIHFILEIKYICDFQFKN